ncbi:vitellogenin isoform X3 [Megalobrama amblycephala]|uniref:vitellogenin isoform X3 n=1 Tax=Megalobrama amblycephala TaxID=75352 RepID=UPI00201448FD|nr:vitellogenin isoform X3 [Megalobrama amblycephala]
MDHNYSLSFAAGFVAKENTKKRQRTGESNDPRRIWDKKRNKTRINIGVAFSRWRELLVKLNLDRDADLACVLLDSYDRYTSISKTSKLGRSEPPPPSVSNIGSQRVCGEHKSSSAALKKRGRPRKTAALQTEDLSQPSPDPHSDQCNASEDLHSDHSQPSPECQSDSESQPSPDPTPTNVEVLGVCYDLPSLRPYKPDKQAQPERREDGSDLDVVIGSIAPSYNFVPHSSSSSTTTEEDNAMHWEEIKDELAQTAQRLEERLDAMRSFTDVKLEPISMTIGKEDQKKWVVNKSSLTGLFRTCHQCGEPVLEFKTLTSGSLIRIQWECSKGHLMWLFPNYNPT